MNIWRRIGIPHGNGWESTSLTDEQKEIWGKFLVEVTQELVYHTAREFKGIRETRLIKRFKAKFGFEPMEFFYWGQFYHYCEYWYEFLRNIPQIPYERYRTTLVSCGTDSFVDETQTPLVEYRESLLCSACKLVTEGNVIDINRKDSCGNTALHLIAALPGDSSSLLQHMLHLGADPLALNDAKLNAVHIIAGRRKAGYGSWTWGQEFPLERIESTSWICDDRLASLSVLPHTLATSVGADDNTAIHECVLSIQTIKVTTDGDRSLIQDRRKIDEEIEIVSRLLESGASLSIPNSFGLVPLHFAFNSIMFEFLLTKGTNCHSNPRGETPFLFILKYFVGLALVHVHSEQANETQEIRNLLDQNVRRYSQMFVRRSPIRNATFVLSQLTKLAQDPAVKSMIWVTDDSQITPLFLLLMFARIACYCPHPERRSKSGRTYSLRGRGWDEVWKHLDDLNEFENALIECVLAVVRAGSKEDLIRSHDAGQRFLHILLDIGTNTVNRNGVISDAGIQFFSRMTSVVKCLGVLIQHGVNVNEQDKQLRTALHLICNHYHKCPQMYQECAKLLAEAGARVDVKDKWGKSVLDYLRRNSHLQAVVCKVRITRKVIHSLSRRHSKAVHQLANGGCGATVVDKCRFTSTQPIGNGAFSNIYAAIKDETENKESGTILCREVAVKRLEKAKIDPRDIEREVKALLAISTQCENIVDYYDTMEDENFSYIILELMDGDLRELIADPKMAAIIRSEPCKARQASLDIVRGLAYLHEKKFLHRDLKPGNILYKVDPRLCLKIADFGLAKETSSSSSMTTTTRTGGARPAGTRCWMAPELVSLVASEHTNETDVFALGLVLHYLLTLGKHPFIPTSRVQPPDYLIEANIADGKVSLNSSLSDEAKHFIGLILAKKPTVRPPASHLHQHPFLWSEKKKVEFLKAMGDQKEAARPTEFPNFPLQQSLRAAKLGNRLEYQGWDARIPVLYRHITTSWPQKRYRTNQVIDLVRFVRNAYAHKEEQPEVIKRRINENLFLKAFPSLVLEVYLALQNERLLDDPERTNIKDALLME